MADYQKAVVEKKAKEIELNLNIKTNSKSLVRYVARVRACKELYKAEADEVIKQMIKKNYKDTPPARSWLDELKASGCAEEHNYLVAALGEPPAKAVVVPKVAGAKPSAPKAPPKVAMPSQPPAAPPQATQNLNDLLGVTSPKQ